MKMKKTSAYVWFDSEFTSLELDSARLLQVAVIMTDNKLNRLHPPEADLTCCIRLEKEKEVSAWVGQNLPELVLRCRSEEAVEIEEADCRIAAMLDTCCGVDCLDMAGRPVLAGNSVHTDWFLIRKYLPLLFSRLHYRLLDVSVIKIQWNDWAEGCPFDKENTETLNQYFPDSGIDSTNVHDALFDIKASIAELAFYRTQLFFSSF